MAEIQASQDKSFKDRKQQELDSYIRSQKEDRDRAL
jgi:hypothetical protein